MSTFTRVIVTVMYVVIRYEEDAAGQVVKVSDRERFRGSGRDGVDNEEEEDDRVDGTLLPVLHHHSSQLWPPATAGHLYTRDGQTETGHASGMSGHLDILN